ncbi:MAG: helix-turn-helix domain-containing protein [Sphingobacteriales bacterium]
MGSQAKIKVITSDKAYQATMEKIDGLMKIGEAKIKPAQAAELRLLSLAAQAYEKSMYTIPAPKTLQGLIEFKMYERKLKQKELAQLLDIAESKLSQILTGKRKPDVSFLKAAHEQLEIDGNILLEYA